MNVRPLKRQVWLLFTDANGRMNILIEECAHLQNTIIGLLAPASPIWQILEDGQKDHDKELASQAHQQSLRDSDPSLGTHELLRRAGINRVVLIDSNRRGQGYGAASSRDRSFFGLWNLLGGLIIGLVENQRQLRIQFHRAYRSLRDSRPDASEEMYWFVNLRGYFIHRGLGVYTAHLEHAHEKIIQMQENVPGVLPAPTLLRRWNSAQHGEFLANYARHLHFEAIHLVGRLRGHKFEEIEERRRRQIVSHTWTHQPTSMVRSMSVHFKKAGTKRDASDYQFGAIQSAYFYLEQPILFPLVYHECAHLIFPEDFEIEREYETGKAQESLKFFLSRIHAFETLRAGLPEQPYENFWEHYTEEVWVDALSLALGGPSYLTALALQIVGQSGKTAFSHGDIERDDVHSLTDLGGPQMRQYTAAWPETNAEYFWVARLRLAIDACKRLCSLDSESLQAVQSLEALVEMWGSSGEIAFGLSATSNEHAQLWEYRRKLNDWVHSSIWRYIAPHLASVRSLAQFTNQYELSSKSIQQIESTIGAYCTNVFGASVPEGRIARQVERAEDLPAVVRWLVSGFVVDSIDIEATQGEPAAEEWLNAYASWVRNDGVSAFRMAMEWLTYKSSLIGALSDLTKETRTLGGYGEDAKSTEAPYGTDEDADQDFAFLDIGCRLRMLRDISGLDNKAIEAFFGTPRCYDTDDCSVGPLPASVKVLIKKIERIADEIFLAITASDDSQPLAAKELAVGTLSLCVMRPWECLRDSDRTASKARYSGALKRTREYGEKSHELKKQWRSSAFRSTKDPSEIAYLPLVGEYQFMSYVHGATPVEREAYPSLPPSMLTKPRLVLQVFGNPLWKAVAPNEETKRVARLSLLQFQYRWQWYDLYRRLKERKSAETAQLFLSSAWEDAILISWCDDSEKLDDELWAEQERALLGLDIDCCRVDPQTNIVVPNLLCTTQAWQSKEFNKELSWAEGFVNWAHESGSVAAFNDRTGRNDYTILWKQANGHSILGSYAQGLNSLPEGFWARVSGMSTSFERTRFASETSLPKHVVVTTLSIRHDP